MNAEKQRAIRAILAKLGIESVGSERVVAQRLGDLSCADLRTLIVVYECSLGDLAGRLWHCEAMKTKKNISNAKSAEAPANG